MTWFCAITVTVAPVIASRPITSSSGATLPISILSPTNLPTILLDELGQFRLRDAQQQDRLAVRRIRTPVMMPWVSMPISVTTGLPE